MTGMRWNLHGEVFNLRILVLSFYFQPDLSAGSFRNTALVSQLSALLPEGSHIDVVTTLPNRYHTFSADAPEIEHQDGLTLYRIALRQHKSGMVDQSRAFLAFAKAALHFVKGKNYDLIFASSSRLMTASLGALVARSKGAPLYLDIRDIFLDTIKDVLPRKIVWAIKPVFSVLEKLTIRSAARVNLVSAGFLPYFKCRYPRQNYSLFTNGIDTEFIQAQPTSSIPSSREVLEVVYAGNMGEGQGLHAIIPALAKRFEGRLRFRLIGDGGRRSQLAETVVAMGCANVDLSDPVVRDELIEAYLAADVLFLHLNDYDAFRKVLPSKIFEYATLGKPVWAGVAGYAADFLQTHVANVAVFPPCDDQEAARVFESLSMVTQPRTDFCNQFARARIMKEMAEDIISLIRTY